MKLYENDAETLCNINQKYEDIKSKSIVAKIGIKDPSFMTFSLTNTLAKIGHFSYVSQLPTHVVIKRVFILEKTRPNGKSKISLI